MVDIDGCVCFSPSYRSKRRWKISCFWPRRLWVRWLIQKNDESRLARETFDAFSSHKNLPSLSDSVHKPRSGSLTRIYIKVETNSRQAVQLIDLTLLKLQVYAQRRIPVKNQWVDILIIFVYSWIYVRYVRNHFSGSNNFAFGREITKLVRNALFP